MEPQALVTVGHNAPQEVQMQLTPTEIKGQVQLIQQVMQAVMQEGFHYGVIPGTDKPTLLKPGAEKLGVTFRLAPKLRIEMHDLPHGHREYQVTCELWHIPTNRLYGEGVGSCSTMESRYRYRHAARKCPHCGKESIIKGKAEYGGGWLCFKNKGGCGAKFAEEDKAITGQEIGKVENADIADTWNTVLKMAKKRALVDATLTATAASDCFTQDLEDFAPEPPPFRVPPPSDPEPRAVTKKPLSSEGDGGAPGPITEGQRKRLFAIAGEHQVSHDDLKRFLEQAYHVGSTKDIPSEQYDVICQAIADGAVGEFLKIAPAA